MCTTHTLKELCKNFKKGTLGTLISSTFRIGHAAEPGYEKTWKLNKDICGGGVVIDPGIHLLHIMITALGYPDDFSMTASTLGWQSEVEDEAVIVFRFHDITMSTHHYSLNMSQNTLFIEFIGTKGVIRLTGRGGNYGSMKFSFVPRWHWKTNEKILEEDYGKEDNSFFNEMEDIVKKLKRTSDYATYTSTMKLLDTLYN